MMLLTIRTLRMVSVVSLLTRGSFLFGFTPPREKLRSRPRSAVARLSLSERKQPHPPGLRVPDNVLNGAENAQRSQDAATPGDTERPIAELVEEIEQLKFELAQRPLRVWELPMTDTSSSELSQWYAKLPLWNNKVDADVEYEELSPDKLRRLNREQLLVAYGKLQRHCEKLSEHARLQEVSARYVTAERDEMRRNMIALRQQLQEKVKVAMGKFDYQVAMRALDRNRAVAELEHDQEKHARELQTALNEQEVAWKQRINQIGRDLNDVRVKLKGAEERIVVRGDIIRQFEGENRSFRSYFAIGWTLLKRRVSRRLDHLRPPPRARVHSIDELILTQKKNDAPNE